MTTWLLLFTTLFRFSNENNSFDQYFIKGKSNKQGVKFQFAYKQLEDFDVLVLERFDTTHKIFVHYKDFTKHDIEKCKHDTFEYVVPMALGKYKVADLFQWKLVSKSHFIKIYNDADAEGVYFTNTEKRLFSLNKQNNGLMQLTRAQKQALKNELKVKEKGYAILEETAIIELEYDQTLEQYFVVAYNQFLEEEKAFVVFNQQRDQAIQMMREAYSQHKAPSSETTWIELDPSFIDAFEHMMQQVLSN